MARSIKAQLGEGAYLQFKKTGKVPSGLKTSGSTRRASNKRSGGSFAVPSRSKSVAGILEKVQAAHVQEQVPVSGGVAISKGSTGRLYVHTAAIDGFKAGGSYTDAYNPNSPEIAVRNALVESLKRRDFNKTVDPITPYAGQTVPSGAGIAPSSVPRVERALSAAFFGRGRTSEARFTKALSELNKFDDGQLQDYVSADPRFAGYMASSAYAESSRDSGPEFAALAHRLHRLTVSPDDRRKATESVADLTLNVPNKADLPTGTKRVVSLFQKIRAFDNPQTDDEADIDKLLGRAFSAQKANDEDLMRAAEFFRPDDPVAGLEEMAGNLDSRNNTLMKRLFRLADGRRRRPVLPPSGV